VLLRLLVLQVPLKGRDQLIQVGEHIQGRGPLLTLGRALGRRAVGGLWSVEAVENCSKTPGLESIYQDQSARSCVRCLRVKRIRYTGCIVYGVV
jgi:hypothetical protein